MGIGNEAFLVDRSPAVIETEVIKLRTLTLL